MKTIAPTKTEKLRLLNANLSINEIADLWRNSVEKLLWIRYCDGTVECC